MAELKAKVGQLVLEATRVTVSVGYTRNMGNFESLRVDIGVSDSARAGENVKATFDRVYAFAEKELLDKVIDTEQSIKAAKTS